MREVHGRGGRIAVALLLSLVALLTGAGNAGAAQPDGVLDPDHVAPGARDVTLVLRPAEPPPAAPAVRFALFLPTGRPLVGVTAPAVPGWTAEVTTSVLPVPAPSADGPVREVAAGVVWTATGAPAPGAPEFLLHVALMPEGAGPVRFRAARTDADGRTVEWSDTWPEGGPKPAHPALELGLGAPVREQAAGGHAPHHGAGSLADAAVAGPGGVAATVLGLLGLAGAVGALVAALARRQRRRFAELHASDRR